MSYRRLTLCLFMFVTVLLSSCSVKVAYGFLDNYLHWELGQYVSLNKQQKKMIGTTFDDFHRWHRATQLTRYANYLQAMQTHMNQHTVTTEYLQKQSDILQDMLDDSAQYLLPGLTQLASTFNDKQIQEIQKNLIKEREKYQKEYIDDSRKKIQKRRIRDITRYIGNFFGRFTEAQNLQMQTWENNLVPFETLMVKQQETWEKDFLKAMTLRGNNEQLQQALGQLVVYRTDNWDATLQEKLDINQAATFAMLAELFNSQTEKQESKRNKQFNNYITDLIELAQKAE